MKFHRQTLAHDPDNGLWGDCGRTAYACLLDLEVEEVPHFFDRGVDPEEAGDAIRDFLSDRGMVRICVPAEGGCSYKQILEVCASWAGGARHMLIGESPRGKWGHVVVVEEGEVIHDPAGPVQEPALVGPEPNTGFWWIEMLGALV